MVIITASKLIMRRAERSSSLSSASSLSDLSSNNSRPNSPHSQSRLCQQHIRKAAKTSTKKSSFSWRSGWHPDRKDEDLESWRGGWPGSEHIAEWRAHLRPTESALSSSSSSPSTSTPALPLSTASSHALTETNVESFLH